MVVCTGPSKCQSTHMPQIPNNQRILGLDIARAIAILSVIAAHTTGLVFGVFGVQLFFIISGYLLADFHLNFSPKNFLIHRYLRLAPLAIISTIIFSFRFSNALEILLNFLLIHALFTGMNSFPGGWSISFEWLFSIVNILLVKIQVKFLFYFLTVILLSQCFVYFFPLQDKNLSTNYPVISLITNLGFFISGHLIKRLNFKLKKYALYIPIIIISPILNSQPPFYLAIYNISLVCLFLICLETKVQQNWFTNIIHFLGVRTYGIFVGHFIVMISLQKLQLFQDLYSNSGYLGQLVYFFIVVCGATFIGHFSYRFIEKPLILFSAKRFSSKGIE